MAASMTAAITLSMGAGAATLQFVRLPAAAPGRPDQASPPAERWLWQADTGWQASALSDDTRTPLGSVWKLFVDAWLRDTRHPAEPYVCTGQDAHEEAYCCTPGMAVRQDAALLQSCGLFFAPQRLGIDAAQWRSYWQQAGAPAWLQDIASMHERTSVPVRSLLDALQHVPASARAASEAALLALPLSGRGETTLPYWGTRIRAKTWTMPDPQRPGESMGGLAGWQADGAAVWLMGEGSSRAVLARAAPLLVPRLQGMASRQGGPCMDVFFFSRYPLRAVTDPSGQAAKPGVLNGRYRVSFTSGTAVEVESTGELVLSANPLEIHGRLSLNDYVARVIDREGDASLPQAARALAVLARTYALQQGQTSPNTSLVCYQIDDSSAYQRVSPRPPTAAARDAADLTDNLVLTGMSARYHGTDAGPGRLSWTEAQDDARQGLTFDAILARRFAQASLALVDGMAPTQCEPLAAAQRWLQDNAQRWHNRLLRQPGYERPEQFAVCRLSAGKPYADFNRMRIYVRALQTQEDRITLAHEYVHLAFAHHPTGVDEDAVEHMARQLLGGVNP